MRNEVVKGIFKTKRNKQNMKLLRVKRFEFLIKLCTVLTLVMFSEYVKADFPKRKGVTV